MARFVTLAGNEVPLAVRPDSVVAARRDLARALSLRQPAQVTLLLSETPLEDADELPREGVVQLATSAPLEGSWARIIWDAARLDEDTLRAALEKDYPLPLEEEVIPEDECCEYWSLSETWAKWCSKQMQLITVRTVGKWADYWSFAASADSYGYWMVKPPFLRSKDKTIDQVVADVKHWSTILHDLDSTFAQIQQRTRGMNDVERMELAAAQLLTYSPQFMVDTSFKYGFETWYGPFIKVLQWYASCADMDEGDARAIYNAVCGVFSSYSVKADGAKQFAQEMARHFSVDFEDFNATEKWKQHRQHLGRGRLELMDASPCNHDAHFAFICEIDEARDPQRAERMKRALLAVRADAVKGETLTMEMVSEWHKSSVMSSNWHHPSRLRRTDAYAKQGRERYPYFEGLEKEFAECLSNAEDSLSINPAVRAARLYLDICFYHPFDDGNGRMARLALEFVLTKAGLCLRDASAIFTIPRRADDDVGAKSFIEAIQQRLAPIGDSRDKALQRWSQNQPSSTGNQLIFLDDYPLKGTWTSSNGTVWRVDAEGKHWFPPSCRVGPEHDVTSFERTEDGYIFTRGDGCQGHWCRKYPHNMIWKRDKMADKWRRTAEQVEDTRNPRERYKWFDCLPDCSFIDLE